MFNIPDSLPPITIALSDYMAIDRMLDHYQAQEDTQKKIAQYLEMELNRAAVVAVKDLPSHVVSMHCSVTYSDTGSPGVHTAVLVYPHEAKAGEGRVSLMSPVGAALIGMEVGRSITWYSPQSGEQTLTVLAVRQPGAAS